MHFKSKPPSISLTAPMGLPLIEKDDDLGELILACLALNSITIETNDVVAVAQKIVSKAEDDWSICPMFSRLKMHSI